MSSADGLELAELSRHYGVPSVDLARFDLDPGVVRLFPSETAWKYRFVPLARDEGRLTIATANPADVLTLDDLQFLTGDTVEAVVAAEAALNHALAAHYAQPPRLDAAGQGAFAAVSPASRGLETLQAALDGAAHLDVVGELDEISAETVAVQGEQAPAVHLVNVLLLSAVEQGASDIHIEPYEQQMRLRYRVDGVLRGVMSPPLAWRDAITARIKVMARLDIAEKRLPQDGRMKVRFTGAGPVKEIDFRVSVLPTLFGEKIVMRLLDRDALMLDLTALGLEGESLARFEAAIARPWGMVLVTGPTGSGKTSTLYSCISRLNRPGINIITVEDPVEFNVAGINQVQVREGIGLDFAAVLRAFLRQDPDIILLGEIRDGETAAIASKAALTGRLVFSTLHTNDAPSAITRLVNMGIDPFLVASSVQMICAQRLVRRVCPDCAGPPAGVAGGGTQPRKGVGCRRCHGLGYRGRIGLYEVMVVTDTLRGLIVAGAPETELRRQAISDGMITLRTSGLRKVEQGLTTIEEVLRETVH